MEELKVDLITQVKSYYEGFIALLPKLGVAVLLLFLTLLVAGWIRSLSKRLLKNRMEDPLLVDFLARIANIICLIVGGVIILNVIGLGGAAASVLAGAGIGAFVIGFAFKDIGENFLAGILMAFKRPFGIGDVIETGDITGKVIGLTLRDTQIKTFNGKDVFVPNGMLLKNPIINRTIDGYLRYDFSVGLDYGDALKKGVEIVKNAINSVPGVLQEPGRQTSVLIEELGASTVNITAYFWIDTEDPNYSGVAVKAEAIERTVIDLTEAGYYLPADIIELKNYQSTPLAADQKPAEASA